MQPRVRDEELLLQEGAGGKGLIAGEQNSPRIISPTQGHHELSVAIQAARGDLHFLVLLMFIVSSINSIHIVCRTVTVYRVETVYPFVVSSPFYHIIISVM